MKTLDFRQEARRIFEDEEYDLSSLSFHNKGNYALTWMSNRIAEMDEMANIGSLRPIRSTMVSAKNILETFHDRMNRVAREHRTGRVMKDLLIGTLIEDPAIEDINVRSLSQTIEISGMLVKGGYYDKLISEIDTQFSPMFEEFKNRYEEEDGVLNLFNTFIDTIDVEPFSELIETQISNMYAIHNDAKFLAEEEYRTQRRLEAIQISIQEKLVPLEQEYTTKKSEYDTYKSGYSYQVAVTETVIDPETGEEVEETRYETVTVAGTLDPMVSSVKSSLSSNSAYSSRLKFAVNNTLYSGSSTFRFENEYGSNLEASEKSLLDELKAAYDSQNDEASSHSNTLAFTLQGNILSDEFFPEFIKDAVRTPLYDKEETIRFKNYFSSELSSGDTALLNNLISELESYEALKDSHLELEREYHTIKREYDTVTLRIEDYETVHNTIQNVYGSETEIRYIERSFIDPVRNSVVSIKANLEIAKLQIGRVLRAKDFLDDQTLVDTEKLIRDYHDLYVNAISQLNYYMSIISNWTIDYPCSYAEWRASCEDTYESFMEVSTPETALNYDQIINSLDPYTLMIPFINDNILANEFGRPDLVQGNIENCQSAYQEHVAYVDVNNIEVELKFIDFFTMCSQYKDHIDSELEALLDSVQQLQIECYQFRGVPIILQMYLLIYELDLRVNAYNQLLSSLIGMLNLLKDEQTFETFRQSALSADDPLYGLAMERTNYYQEMLTRLHLEYDLESKNLIQMGTDPNKIALVIQPPNIITIMDTIKRDLISTPEICIKEYVERLERMYFENLINPKLEPLPE